MKKQKTSMLPHFANPLLNLVVYVITLTIISFLVVGIFRYIRTLLAKGQIIEIFVLPLSKNPALFLLLDYRINTMTKVGAVESHDYRLKKINLDSFDVEFETKLLRTADKMLKILDITENEIVIEFQNDDFLVLDTKSGGKIYSKKEVFKMFQTQKIKIKHFRYNFKRHCYIFFDEVNTGYYIDTQNFVPKNTNIKIKWTSESNTFLRERQIPSMTVISYQTTTHKPYEYCPVNSDWECELIADENKEDYFFMNFFEKNTEQDPKELIDSFFYPQILRSTAGKTLIIKANPPTVAIIHSLKRVSPEKEDFVLSAVTIQSKELFSKKIVELAGTLDFNDEHILFALVLNKKFFSFYLKKYANKLCLTEISTLYGKIIRQKILSN